MNNFEIDYRSLLISNFVLVIITLFVVIYIIINYENVFNGDIFNGRLCIVKVVLITGIISLIVYLFTTWDIDDVQSDIEIKKFTLNNNKIGGHSPISKQILQPTMKNILAENILAENILAKNILVDNRNKNAILPKYNIVNNLQSNNIDKLNDTNIFIPQKHIGRYGIKL